MVNLALYHENFPYFSVSICGLGNFRGLCFQIERTIPAVDKMAYSSAEGIHQPSRPAATLNMYTFTMRPVYAHSYSCQVAALPVRDGSTIDSDNFSPNAE
jgi:hypothetical protein